MTAIALFLLMTAGTIALLVLPFLRRQATPDRSEFDLSIYRDQLRELDRDLERGVIEEEAARAAKLEIERRILATADGGNVDRPADGAEGGSPMHLATAVALVLAVPLVSGFYYVSFGRPDMPDMPLASRAMPEQQLAAADALETNINQLRQHLETTPDNGPLWADLGRNELRAGRYQLAVEAFAKAAGLMAGNPMIKAEHAEAMVYAAGGQVTPAALDQFKAALQVVPNEPRSRYYLGLALAQEGEIDAAIEGWSQLLEVSPSDAPWRPQIVEAVRSALESVGRPADEVVARLPRGGAPSESITTRQAGIEALSPDQQNEEIRGMVEGLAARLEDAPGDIDGWLMLGRSRMVLGEVEAAKSAFEQAIEQAPDRPDILLAYASALLQPSETPGGDPIVVDEAKALYQKLLKLAPNDPEPRWLLGVAAAQAGNKEAAVTHWQALLGLIEEGSEDHNLVKARIEALEGGEAAAQIAAGAAPSITRTVTPSSEAAAGATEETTESSSPQPTAEDMAEMASLSADDRNARIRAMVDGLAARLDDDPSDIEGWLRLAQSRNVLGETEAAREAYRRAMEAAPERPDVIRAYASSLLGEVNPETNVATVGDEAAELYEKLIELEPDDPEAHWYLGLAAVQDGTTEDAKTHWQRVLDVLGPDHPNYAAVQSSLKEVDTKTQ